MQKADNTLDYSRKCFEGVFDAPYPDDYLIGSHWLNIRERSFEAIRQFETPQEAVLYAQVGSISGFDHRARGHRWSIEFKARELTRVFPGFDFNKHPELTESPSSNPETLEQIGESQFSNIFLTHLNHYLRSTAGLEKSAIKNVLEIGAGYGGLARIFKLMAPNVRYTIVDLPESLFFAQVFLS